MGLLVGLVIAAIFSWRRISIFRGWIHPGRDSRRLELRGLCPPPFQHPRDTEILVEVRPVDAHRHNLEIRPLLRRGTLQPPVPIERRCDLASIHKRHHELGRGELNRARVEVADVNFQSSHSRPPVAARDVIEGGG